MIEALSLIAWCLIFRTFFHSFDSFVITRDAVSNFPQQPHFKFRLPPDKSIHIISGCPTQVPPDARLPPDKSIHIISLPMEPLPPNYSPCITVHLKQKLSMHHLCTVSHDTPSPRPRFLPLPLSFRLTFTSGNRIRVGLRLHHFLHSTSPTPTPSSPPHSLDNLFSPCTCWVATRDASTI